MNSLGTEEEIRQIVSVNELPRHTPLVIYLVRNKQDMALALKKFCERYGKELPQEVYLLPCSTRPKGAAYWLYIALDGGERPEPCAEGEKGENK